jgi:hypothetical protein
MFPKPGQTAPSHKWTYVKRVTIDGAPAPRGRLLPGLTTARRTRVRSGLTSIDIHPIG